MIKTGAKAPPFSLPDQDGKAVSLRDLAGRWTVLADGRVVHPRGDGPDAPAVIDVPPRSGTVLGGRN